MNQKLFDTTISDVEELEQIKEFFRLQDKYNYRVAVLDYTDVSGVKKGIKYIVISTKSDHYDELYFENRVIRRFLLTHSKGEVLNTTWRGNDPRVIKDYNTLIKEVDESNIK